MIRGQLRADGIVVAAFNATFLTQAGFEMKAEIKLVDTKSGRTLATASVVNWPPEVVEKVKELTEAMERAVGSALFVSGPVDASMEGSKPGIKPSSQGSGGLGEFLDGQDAPPV